MRISLKNIAYGGWDNCLRLLDGILELICTDLFLMGGIVTVQMLAFHKFNWLWIHIGYTAIH